MLHLNEHGWGLSTLIAFIFVFLLAILLISVNAYKMGLTTDNVSNLPISRPGDNDNRDNSSNDISSSNNSNSNIDNNGNGSTTSSYLELENKLKSAGIMYKDTYYNTLVEGDSVYVTSKQLLTVGFLNDSEFSSSECTGYVKIKNNNGSFEYSPYLDCGNSYQTSGYVTDLAK